jgi:hypothetical protein
MCLKLYLCYGIAVLLETALRLHICLENVVPVEYCRLYWGEFYVLLTVHVDIILLNNHLDAQFFFMYVYFYSLHVAASHVPIITRINCINMTSGICHSV